MRSTPNWRRLALFAALLAGLPARGVIFYSTGDPSFNTKPPTGRLARCGWQWVGDWGSFQGTVIGPHQFLSARHVGGQVGDIFFFNGVRYAATAFFDDPKDDLRIWVVRGTFLSWAPLFRRNDEVGRRLVVMGRGLGRGAPVEVHGAVRGWHWGGGGGRMRWGEGTVAAVVDGGRAWGSLLLALFQPSSNPNEADLSSGDSGGPVFVDDGGRWMLAGVAAAVAGPFSTTGAGDGFGAAIFDGRGLYARDDANHWKVIEAPKSVPTGYYATRVSTRTAWIDSILQLPYRPSPGALPPRPGRIQ